MYLATIDVSACRSGLRWVCQNHAEAASRFSAYVKRSDERDLDTRTGPNRFGIIALGHDDSLASARALRPMAAITAPDGPRAQHQSLLHFVGEGNSVRREGSMLAKRARKWCSAEQMERHGPIEAWIIDDTGFQLKKRTAFGWGRRRQYSR